MVQVGGGAGEMDGGLVVLTHCCVASFPQGSFWAACPEVCTRFILNSVLFSRGFHESCELGRNVVWKALDWLGNPCSEVLGKEVLSRE